MRKLSGHSCCGCGVCAEICPAHCISMERDGMGFLYPCIDAERCRDCGLCHRSCPENQVSSPAAFGCYYAVSGDAATVGRSSSGGVFSELARCFLEMHGVVVGAAFTSEFQVEMQVIESPADLARLRQSKYVQAVVPGGMFRIVQRLLRQGRPVLFTGTPCQIGAFRAFLGDEEYPRLLLAEIICHGVPAPGVWESYLRKLTRDWDCAREDLVQVKFRDKASGWHRSALSVSVRDGRQVRETLDHNGYLRLFLRDVILRPSCHDCRFKRGLSGADLSLGDFWNLRRLAPELENDTGASMVLTHTDRGLAALRRCRLGVLKQMEPSLVVKSNPAYHLSSLRHPNAARYRRDFQQAGGKWIDPDPYLKLNAWQRLRRKLRRLTYRIRRHLIR